MARKRRDVPQRRKDRPRTGVAGCGSPVDPMALPEEADESPSSRERRAAPAPGVPVSDREYERLKKEADSGPAPDQAPAQEDRPTAPGR